MTSDWFRLPETGDGTQTDPKRPDLFGHNVDGWAGNNPDPNGPSQWVVRVHADEQTLNNMLEQGPCPDWQTEATIGSPPEGI